MALGESLIPAPRKGALPNWAEKALETNNFSRYELERLASLSFPTSVVMWAYSLLAMSFFTDSEVSYLCLALSLVHSATPYFSKYFSGMLGLSLVFLGTCLGQQILLSYATGGIPSTALIWYGAVPILGGVLAGKRGLLIWCALTFSVVAYFLFSAKEFPDLLPDRHKTIAAIIDISSWIFTVIVMNNIIIKQRESYERQLTKKSERINNLLRILTHDVTNSLSMIQMASALYKRGAESGRPIERYLEKMELASGHINEVIGCVRTLHSAENDWQPLEFRPVDLRDCVNRCIQLLEDSIKAKGISFKIGRESLSKESIIADPLFLNNQVLMNALTNAVKFSPPGGVIEVKGVHYKKYFGVSIKDQGEGMTREFVKSLYKEKMIRSTPGTCGEGGSGFGILILKSFMDRFGGKVHFNSIKGEGTEVRLLFRFITRKSSKRHDFGLGQLIMEGLETERPY